MTEPARPQRKVWLVIKEGVYDHGCHYVAESLEDAERFCAQAPPDDDGWHSSRTTKRRMPTTRPGSRPCSQQDPQRREMSDQDESIPGKVTIVPDDDTTLNGFKYRFTCKEGGVVALEIGDLFIFNPAFGEGEGAMMAQAGLDMAVKGMHFLGVDTLGRQALSKLILTYANGVTLETSEEDDL